MKADRLWFPCDKAKLVYNFLAKFMVMQVNFDDDLYFMAMLSGMQLFNYSY